MAKLVIGTNKQVVVPAIVHRVEPVVPFPLLSRVMDDNSNEIGTVCGYHKDANNVEYAVVALDAVYRLANGQGLSVGNVYMEDVPGYLKHDVYGAKETATFNCNKIMEWVNAEAGRSSEAVSHCHSKVFTIGGQQYVAQLPTVIELIRVFEQYPQINSLDPTAAANPDLVIKNSGYYWTSTQYHDGSTFNFFFCLDNYGRINSYIRTNSCFVVPILEIPNAVSNS